MNLNEHIECFKTNYKGLDPSLFGRLQFLADALGTHELTDIDADQIDGELRRLIERVQVHSRRGAGVVVTGKPRSAFCFLLWGNSDWFAEVSGMETVVPSMSLTSRPRQRQASG